ncbi:MAG: hypothetical protein EU551_04265 [Promethearchaeota archaeon]|jgi:hypothetical protein|nr:MAG: hypothetical protein EU551_04265 [Candidatus Lokiarchaeota archaeon]
MPKIDKEAFIKRVYVLVNEMKVPLIDSKTYHNCNIIPKRATVHILFKYEEGEDSRVKGFLGLADYYHTVVIRMKNSFYIPIGSILFELTI